MKWLKLFSLVVLLGCLKISDSLAEIKSTHKTEFRMDPKTEKGRVIIYLGYLTQIHCRGRLYLSSMGNSELIQWEAFPKEMGCGVVLKPKGLLGSTDLLLKTSTGDFHLLIEVQKPAIHIQPQTLEIDATAEKD